MSDAPRDFTVDLLAATALRIEARGRFFGIIEAPVAALDVQFDSGAPLRRGPGGSVMLPAHFSRVTITSAIAQTVRVLISDDVQDVSNVVTGGGGGIGITVDDTPSATVAALADNALAAASSENIAANPARLRITIGCLSSNGVGIRVTGGASPALSGIEIAPGTYCEFRTSASLDVRNDDPAVATSYYIFEES